MGVNLSYDSDDFTTAMTNIEKLKSQLGEDKKAMIEALENLRKDWVSEGGDAFFDSIDNDWQTSVDNCISVLDDLKGAIKAASDDYAEISTDSIKKLTF